MALSHYAAIYKDTFLDFCSDFARFLVNDLTSFTGPGWTIVEAYDDTVGSRQVPSVNTDMDSFTGTFSWKDNTVAVGDWIVLRSVRGTTEFQVFFKIASSTTIEIMVVPLDDWATDVGTPTATPTTPTTAFGAGAAPITMTGFLEKEIYSIVADNGMCSFLFEDLAFSCNWTYLGETLGGPVEDTRPFVIWDATGTVRWADLAATNGNWTRLSPFDDTTILTNGVSATWIFLTDITRNPHTNFFLGLPDSLRPLPVGLTFQDAGHHSFTGFLHHVFSASSLLGANGTLDGLSYLFRNNETEPTFPAICLAWDGVTNYPPPPF